MTAIATVPSAALPVEPGGEATYELTVRNTGSVVDAFTVEPLGEAAPWTVVDPAELPLFPGAEGSVLLRFRPPRSPSTRAGQVPWAVRITSRENPAWTWVEEGVLEVAPFYDVTAELAPQTSRARGRRAGKHQLAVDNRGNVATEVRLLGGDDDGNVTVDIRPAVVTLQPGTAQITTVRTRARRRFWRGPAKSHPYRVAVDRGDGEPRLLPATLLQETVVPGWLVKALIALLLVALLLAGLWRTVLKPTINDAARAVAGEEAAEVAKKEAATAAKQAMAEAQQAAASGAKPQAPASPAPKPSASPAPIDPLGNPVSFRIAATAGDQDISRALSGDSIVSVTDLFFQNPDGDAGRLEVFAAGDLIYSTRLNNWRDLDQHANAPYEFKPDDEVRIKVTCENKPVPPAAAAKPCTPAVTLVGYARKPAK
jgi:hypothetical protein